MRSCELFLRLGSPQFCAGLNDSFYISRRSRTGIGRSYQPSEEAPVLSDRRLAQSRARRGTRRCIPTLNALPARLKRSQENLRPYADPIAKFRRLEDMGRQRYLPADVDEVGTELARFLVKDNMHVGVDSPERPAPAA